MSRLPSSYFLVPRRGPNLFNPFYNNVCAILLVYVPSIFNAKIIIFLLAVAREYCQTFLTSLRTLVMEPFFLAFDHLFDVVGDNSC